ncbi:MAG: TolC family outer membrane protein [Alphaproteobacteria bacterium]|nr:TolC family outer membrane protein [Alphaproteobacteria bacterium]
MKKSFLFTLLTATTVATNAYCGDIFDAMGNAYNNNPTLEASRAYLRSVDENVAIAKSGFRPKLSVQGSYRDTHLHNDVVQTDTGYDESVSIQAEQSIFSGFSTYNSVKAAKEGVKAEQSNLSNVEQQILLEASTAYLNVLRDTSIVDLQENNEKLLKKRLDETIERFNVGEVTRTDVSQAEARHSQAISDRIAAQGNLAASKAIYTQIVGNYPSDLVEPEGLSALFPASLDDALSYAKTNNYGLKAAKSALESRKHTVNANTGALLPNVSFVAMNTRGQSYNSSTKDPETNSYVWEARMSVPLYNSGETRAKIRQSKYQKWQAQEQVLEAERAMISSVNSNWEYMVSNKARIQSVKDQIKAYEIALDGVQQEEALGNRTVLDVLDAYQSLLNSKVEEVRARRDYYVSGMQLLMSMGKLTAQDLKLGVDIYDAKKHSKETAGKWLSLSVEK